MSLNDDLDRIARWKKNIEESPGENAEIIRERFLGSEVLQPIVNAWKQKVAALEAQVAQLTQERNAAKTLIVICREYAETPGSVNRVSMWVSIKQALALIDKAQEGEDDAGR